MKVDEVLDVLSLVRLWWPHSDVDGGDPAATARGWHAALAGYNRDDVEAAVRRLLASGREHAPVVGLVVQSVELTAQGDAPGFDDVQATLARLLPSCSPYSPTASYSPADTADTIRRLAARGVHEAVLRFVAAHGLRAIKRLPDPSLQPLDRNQQADRRDAARDYAQRIVPDWRADPTPGRALARAERGALEGGRSGLRQLSTGRAS